MESFRAVHVGDDWPRDERDDEKSSKIFHSDGHSRRLPRTRTVPLIDPVAIVSRNYEGQVRGWPVFTKARADDRADRGRFDQRPIADGLISFCVKNRRWIDYRSVDYYLDNRWTDEWGQDRSIARRCIVPRHATARETGTRSKCLCRLRTLDLVQLTRNRRYFHRERASGMSVLCIDHCMFLADDRIRHRCGMVSLCRRLTSSSMTGASNTTDIPLPRREYFPRSIDIAHPAR